MNVLALNSGSNSLKFEVVRVSPGQALGAGTSGFGETVVSGAYDNISKDHGTFTIFSGDKVVHKADGEIRDYGHAAELMCEWLDNGARDYGFGNLRDIERIGHRVVHGGDFFKAPALINEDVIGKIEDLEDLAPLHNASALEVIRILRSKVAEKIPMVAVFDTVFHQSIPDEAALYALPVDLAKRHHIRRYGFHGISHHYLMLRYAQLTGRELSGTKLITLHLEGGSSVAAIREGRSVETSMGFTPLEGLVMGTRTGDLDPALVPYLMRKEGLDPKQVEEFLNKKCGLLGLSGVSSDTRDLIGHLDNPAVDLALNIFCHRVRKYIGAYLSILGGADAIVLGGGISENTALVRERICRDLEWFGLVLDKKLNEKIINREGVITSGDSRIEVWVIPSRENLMVAHETAEYGLQRHSKRTQ